jgi:hypothetical protein
MKTLSYLGRKHPKTTQRTGRKTRNEKCGHETSQLGHTTSFNNKDNTFPKNNDHRTTYYLTAMNKPSEPLFDGTPENWPEFEHHLLTEAKKPTIRWNQEITNYQPTDETSEPFNFL